MTRETPTDVHRRAHVLVVEDDNHLGDSLALLLSRHYRVTTTADSQEAIARLESEAIDLVVLDIILTRGTGIHVIEHLAQRAASAPPVVVISALSHLIDLQPFDPIVTAKIAKPVALDEMLKALEDCLKGGRPKIAVEPKVAGSTILVVDDHLGFLEKVTAYLRREGYEVDGCASGAEALEALSTKRYDAVVTDWIMPGLSGVDLLTEIKRILPEVPVLLMTGHGTPGLSRAAVAAMAADVLTKPFPPQALPIALEKCLRLSAAPAAISAPGQLPRQGKRRVRLKYGLEDIRGESASMRRARQALIQVAPTDSSVLILGETGTGKELFAQALHGLSNRSEGPFVAVNAAAIPEALMESELFGYEGGAFTGARKEGRLGKFVQASGGTLFLDEIGDLPLSLQVKLLRVLQEGEVEVLGGYARRVDVRLVAATHRDLSAMLRQGKFRADLFYRLHVVTLRIPPLRQRRDDIPHLAQHFLDELCRRYDRPAVSIAARSLHLMCEYSWPGNVRELRNAVERAFVFSQGASILPVHLPPEIRRVTTASSPSPAAGTAVDMASHEYAAIVQALQACGGNKVRAAQMLGISRSGLYLKMKAYGISGSGKP